MNLILRGSFNDKFQQFLPLNNALLNWMITLMFSYCMMYFEFFCFKNYLLIWEGERDRDPISWFVPKYLQWLELGPTQRHEPGIQSGSPTWVSVTQSPEPSSLSCRICVTKSLSQQSEPRKELRHSKIELGCLNQGPLEFLSFK